MIGLPKGIVRLVPHAPIWQQLFEEECERLYGAVGRHVLDIQHVGSTAIPGIVAKPIIDIAIAVTEFEAARVCIDPLVELEYEFKGENGIPRRHYFSRGDPTTHHIHMVEIRSRDWRDLTVFRDILREHPNIASEYAKLKIELARTYPADRLAYTDGKAEFIEHVLSGCGS